MLYIIGGTSRSGKTLLARKAVVEKQIPYFPLDALVGGLVHGAPDFNVRYDDSFVERAEKMWPVTKYVLKQLSKEEKNYLVEGDSITPQRIKELQDSGIPLKACFIGYSDVTKEEKLSLVRQHHQGEIDWTKKLSDKDHIAIE